MIKKKQLGNGVTVLFEYLPYVQSAAIGVWVRAGAADETPCGEEAGSEGADGARSNAGVSHFIEHMMFKGTEKRTAKAIAEDIDRIGGSINAFTGKEATCYYVKTLSTHIDASIDVLADMLNNSLFDPEETEKERNVILEEIKMIEDAPDDIGHDLINEQVFFGSRLGHRVIGFPKTVSSITRDDMLAYIADRYIASGIVVALSGNFAEDEVMDRLERGFGSLGVGVAERTIPAVPHTPRSMRRKKDIEQTHIFLGARGVSLTHDDYYRFLLYNSILGGGMSSRLFQNIREEQGLAYSVYSSASSFVGDGLLTIYAGVGQDKETAAIDAIRAETERLAETGVDEEELNKAKEQNKGHYIFGQESVSSRMFAAGKNMLLLDRVYSAEEIMAGIDAVTRADIARIAERYADLASYSRVIISAS
ncbi:MAG: insulinase family protein [Clostridiales Family XIII bacterium]|jgi:predicted Zn-dependent peptidase|nr:insulinase family protein [Clostridiales Family XIII bacterium]